MIFAQLHSTWCTNWTATDPAPTADATLLIGLARTSPTANTPVRSFRRGTDRARRRLCDGVDRRGRGGPRTVLGIYTRL